MEKRSENFELRAKKDSRLFLALPQCLTPPMTWMDDERNVCRVIELRQT
jgi:hypothetical protein